VQPLRHWEQSLSLKIHHHHHQQQQQQQQQQPNPRQAQQAGLSVTAGRSSLVQREEQAVHVVTSSSSRMPQPA
jgi:hypothetical protein